MFRLHHLSGESMLELTDQECQALQIVVLRTVVRTLDNVVSVFSILCVLALFFSRHFSFARLPNTVLFF